MRAISALLLLVLSIHTAKAQDLTWTGFGGSNWNTTTTNWKTATSISTAWNNANTHSAIFGSDEAGPVTVTSAITLRGINVQANNYIIGGTQTLTFANAGSSTLGIVAGEIRVSPNISATINAPMAGTVDLIKTGTGTLILGGASNFGSGNVRVNFGTLNIIGGGSVSNANGIIGDIIGSSGTVTVGGGTGTST